MRLLFLPFVAALTAMAPIAAIAQTNACDVAPEDWAAEIGPTLVGDWSVSNGPGLVVVGGMTFPLVEEPDENLTIWELDGRLVGSITSADYSGDIDISFAPDESWSLTPAADSPFASAAALDLEELSIFAGCPPDRVVRVRIYGEFPVEGSVMKITLNVLIVGEDIMTGVARFDMVMQGMNSQGRRITTLIRK